MVAKHVLRQVEVFADVYDAHGDYIGHVASVYLGEPEMVGLQSVMGTSDEYFVPEEPDAVPDELLNSGYIRVNTAFSAGESFIAPDEISQVDRTGVHLTITRFELLMRQA